MNNNNLDGIGNFLTNVFGELVEAKSTVKTTKGHICVDMDEGVELKFNSKKKRLREEEKNFIDKTPATSKKRKKNPKFKTTDLKTEKPIDMSEDNSILNYEDDEYDNDDSDI